MAATGCAIAAIACGLVAVWIYAEPRVGPVGAPLIVAGILVLVCVGMLVAARLAMKRPPVIRRPAPPVAAVMPVMLHGEAKRMVNSTTTRERR